ncbi:hypothetical protein RHGRI_015780 [Rhododendron griersonianum]|uniref:Uncharacterized protein n=1 Tax=Rhododendron griersonianum TaxID=479676 RepID=A0AAV6JTB7_9ERIC|nr:hypothetical protein RHGRI_015780 [Rhododendron griersonianum]
MTLVLFGVVQDLQEVAAYAFVRELRALHISGRIAEWVAIMSLGIYRYASFFCITSPFAGLYLICLCSVVCHAMSFFKISIPFVWRVLELEAPCMQRFATLTRFLCYWYSLPSMEFLLLVATTRQVVLDLISLLIGSKLFFTVAEMVEYFWILGLTLRVCDEEMQGYAVGDKDEVRILPMLICSSHVRVWVVAGTAFQVFVLAIRFLLTLTHWLGADGCSDVVGIQGIVRLWAGNHDSFGVAYLMLSLVWVGFQVVQHSSENVFELVGLWMVVAGLELVVVSMAPYASSEFRKMFPTRTQVQPCDGSYVIPLMDLSVGCAAEQYPAKQIFLDRFYFFCGVIILPSAAANILVGSLVLFTSAAADG